ncbi:hypothetical protein BDQ17DRAFT_1329569 [Cyathus striatus]|nr:hypothetical protein BDQ17DRAFT_1336582 [Cyathus striatus]KAF8997066.1 hypothetical protein BDQ17DRAFT_1329569 [Cyathus striatus]
MSKPLLYSSLDILLGADALITGSLCILLAKSRSGFEKLTNFNLDSVYNYYWAVNNYIIWPHNFISTGIYFVLRTVYYNSLLASLNAQHMFCAKLNIGMNPL